jgi:hypothetical protein
MHHENNGRGSALCKPITSTYSVVQYITDLRGFRCTSQDRRQQSRRVLDCHCTVQHLRTTQLRSFRLVLHNENGHPDCEILAMRKATRASRFHLSGFGIGLLLQVATGTRQSPEPLKELVFNSIPHSIVHYLTYNKDWPEKLLSAHLNQRNISVYFFSEFCCTSQKRTGTSISGAISLKLAQ